MKKVNRMSDNEITVMKKNEIFGYSTDDISTIKSVMSFDMSDTDLKVFLHICRNTKLDPVMKQIYAIPRGGKMTIQTSIDGFRLIAERSGKYSPGKDTEFLYCSKGKLMGAKVYVKKMTNDGTWHDISATAFLHEYNPNQGLWKKIPSVMIEKCAEARALRRAFPADLSGLYSDDEMDQADSSKNNTAPKYKKNETKVVETLCDSAITDAEWKNLDAYINGHTELREKLTKMCRVDNLKDITKVQLGACRGYAQAVIDKHKEKEISIDSSTN